MLLHYGELSTILPVIAEIPERSKLEETPLPQGNPLYTRGVATLTQPLTDPVATLTQPLTSCHPTTRPHLVPWKVPDCAAHRSHHLLNSPILALLLSTPHARSDITPPSRADASTAIYFSNLPPFLWRPHLPSSHTLIPTPPVTLCPSWHLLALLGKPPFFILFLYSSPLTFLSAL